MNPQIQLRKANLHDLEDLQKLYSERILLSCQQEYKQEQLDAWASSTLNLDRWGKAISNQFFIIAHKEESILGFGSLADEELIDFLYVNSTHQKKGIGDLIYTELENEAKRQNKFSLYSNVSKTALLFFDNKGFKLIRTQKISSMELN